MYCSKCGARLPDDSLFCPFCGERTAAAGSGEQTKSVFVQSSRKKEETEANKVMTELVRSYQKDRQETVFEQIYKLSFARLVKEAATFQGLKNGSDIREDVVQNAFIKFYTHPEALQDPSSFYAYMKRICINELCSIARTRSGQEELTYDVQDDEGNTASFFDNVPDTNSEEGEKILAQAELQALLLKTINGLPEKQRLAMLMYYRDNISIKEISEELAIPESTVKVTLMRARQKMNGEMKSYCDANGLKMVPFLTIPFLAALFSMDANAAGLPEQAVRDSYAKFINMAHRGGFAASAARIAAGAAGSAAGGAAAGAAAVASATAASVASATAASTVSATAAAGSAASATAASTAVATAKSGIAVKVAAIAIASAVALGGYTVYRNPQIIDRVVQYIPFLSSEQKGMEYVGNYTCEDDSLLVPMTLKISKNGTCSLGTLIISYKGTWTMKDDRFRMEITDENGDKNIMTAAWGDDGVLVVTDTKDGESRNFIKAD